MTDNPPTRPAPSGAHFAPEALSALLDGEPAGAPPAEIEAHLESCAGCRRHYGQLADARRLLSGLATPAPPGRAATAVAAALEAVREGAPADAGIVDSRSGSLLDLRRRQQRIRVAGIAASALLVAGGVSGLILALGHRASVSSAAASSATSGVRHAPTPGRVPGPLAGTVQLGEAEGHRPSGPALAILDPGDVAGIAISSGSGGTFRVTITLVRQHPLVSQTIARLRAGRASAVLSGRTTGVVHILSPRLVEISGLTKSEATELKRLLG